MTGLKKLAILAVFLVTALLVLPFLIVPLPYEGLDWLTLGKQIYYDATPQPGRPPIYLPVNGLRVGGRTPP